MKRNFSKEDKEFLKRVGRNLKFYRVLNGFTAASLGEKMGVSHQQIYKYESGLDCLNLLWLERLTSIFDISLQDLLGVENKETDANRIELELIREFNFLPQKKKKAFVDVIRACNK